MARSDGTREYVVGKPISSGSGRSGKNRTIQDTSFGGKLAYIGESTVAGLAGVFEGIGKTFGTIGAKFAGDERLARYYARKSTVGEWQSDLAEKYSPDAITRFLGDAGAGVGQSSVFLLNLAVPGAGWAAFGTGIYGNALGSAVEKTGELGFREFTYAGLSTAGEMLAEKISGATMKAVGRIGGSVSGSLTKNAVESAATAGAKKGFIKAVASNAVLKDLLKESSSEFVEEFLGDFYDVGISRLTGVDPDASTTITSALYSGLVGFVSGGFMSGTSIIVNRAAAASRGYSIIEAGNADTMVRTAKTIVEEASQAELFKDPSGYVDALRQSVSEYEGAKDKTGYGARVSLGMMQMLTAYVDKNIGLAKTKLKIANADAASLEQMASVLSYYSGDKVTAEDIRANKDGAADRLAIMDWVNGVLTVDMDELNEAVIHDTMSGRKTVSGIAESEFDVSGGAKTVSMPDGSYLSYRKNAEGTYDYVINDGASAESGEDGVWTAKSVSEEEMRNIYERIRQGAQAYQAEVEKRKAEQAQKADAEKADGSDKAEKPKTEKKERKKVQISQSAAEKAGKYVRNFSSLSFRDRLAIARMIESAEKYGVDEKTVKGIACMMSVRSGLEIRFSKALGESGMWSALKGERRLIAVNPELSDAIGRTVSHELIHDMMSDGKEARDSLVEITKEYAGEDQFSAYMESRRKAYFKAMNKAGAVHGEAVETLSADGKKSTEYRFASKADETYFEDVMEEEAVAHFGSVYLQERDFLDRYGSRFAGPLKRAWNRIRNWISLVRAKDRDAAIAMESYTQTISKYLSDTYGVDTLKVAMGIETDNVNTNSTIEKSETRYSLPAVSPVKPSSQEWKPTIDTAEAKKRFPSLWDVTADESQTRNPTQIRSTVSTYRKIYDILKAEGFSGKILDASSGLGYGTRAGIDEYGFEVDDIEPYPDRSYSPKYTDYSALDGKYDAIISNAVLNVLPQDQRDALVVKMGNLLADGGKLYVNVRGDDVNTLSSNPSNVKIGDMEWFVSSTGSYQKGFTRNELVAYLKDALGSDFEVQGTSKFGKASAIVTKKENVGGKSKIGENTRFELKIGNQTTPVKVQETKNLIAIHNLTEQNLLDTLNLGGFPMPSIAVVKADQGHSEYGDISVIFGKETIDPQINSKNAIYGGDAWTPTYPTIEYKVAEKVADRIRNKYYDLARKFGYDDVRPLYKYANDLEDTLNKAKGEAELISSLVDDEDMMRVFLMDSGKGKIPTVQTEVRTEMSPAEVERAKFFINALGEDVVRGIKAPEGERIGFYRQKYLDEHSDAIRNAYHELLTKEYGATEEEAQRVLENAKRYDLFRIVNDAYHYLENGGVTVRTETDSAASSKAVRDAVDTKQYRTWLKDIFGGIEEKSGIRNERDPFDSRGNRRKWETLHWENTLENVVQAMLEQPDVGKGTIFSATSIWGVSAKEYKTIADMKKDTARLKTMSQQQYDTIRAGFEERLTAIADSIRDVKADNEFIARDNAISAIVEAVRTKKTGSSMLAYLKGYSNRATAQTVKDIISLVRDISDMPTQYFEAKPKRAVDFSEIKMVELPESASDTLKKQLERRKIPYEVYGKTDEDRATAVKKLNDVRFELDAKDGYSRGQMAKIVANRTKQKVYERKDAIYAIDRAADIITDYYSDAYGVRRARLRGKSRDEVIDYLFEQMNKEQGDGRLQTAVTAAEYIVNHAIIQNELDSVAADDYARLIDIVNGIDGFRKKVKLTETEIGDIRHIYDKKASAVLRSWYGENGFLPSQILTELRDSGVIVNSDSDVESDIFSDLLASYDNAKESIAKWNEKILLSSMASKEEVKAFKNSIAHEILRAFDETGEKSTYRKEIEARQKYISDTIAKYNQKLKAARRRAMAEARLFRDAMELENLIKRDRQLHSFFQDDRVKKLSESAVNIGKPRNARNPSTVREWAKAMLEVYNPKNELMQIDGESDTYADPQVVEALQRLSQIKESVYRNGENRKNKYLTDEQVIDLQTAVSGLKRLYREYDTVFLNGKRVSLTDTAQNGIDNFKWILERNEKKGKRFTFLEKSALFGKDYIYEIASPLSVIADMEFHDPNGVLTQAYENIVYGQMKSQVQLAMLSKPFEKFYKENKGYRKKLAREYVHYKDVKLTKAQAVSLYCTMKREQAKLGLETFGIKYVNENGKEVESGKFTTVDPDILWNQFDSTDRKFVETVEKFFNEVSKKVKSEADMRIIGSTNVLQDYYFPISRDPIQKISNMTDMRGMLDALQTVVRMSFNQNTVKHADGRLYISDVTAVLDRHMAGLAVYSNLYEELQAFNRIYNKNVTPSDTLGNPIRSQMKSVREMLESTYKGANKYLNKLMADIQGVRIGEEGKFEPILNRFTGLFAQAAISGNIKTALLPLASYPAAGLHIDAKYLMQALAMHASKKAIRENIEQMDKYSSVTKGRYMERGAIRAQTVQSEVKGLIAYTGKGIEATEHFMVSKIWNAAKLQTAAESGLAVESDENCRLAAKLLDKTITETQAQYVSSMKSAMARSHNPLVRGFTMFKSDAAAMFSYNFDAFRKYQHLKERADAGQDVKAELDEAKKKLPRAIGSMAASCVSFAIITQLVRYVLNQDDDDEETPVKNIAMNTLNSMVSMFPVVADVYEFFVDGYEMSNFALDGVNDALKSVKNIIDLIGQKNVTNADIARTVRSALYSFGTLAGIPVRNTVNLATGVIRRFSKPTMYAYDSIFSGEQYAKDLAKAVERGDMKMAQAVIKVMYEREKAGAYDEKTLNEVLRLYEAGYENVIPDSVRSSVTVNGTVIDLSSDQLEQFRKIYAEADSTIQAMMQGDAYNGFSDEQKAYAIRSVYNSYKRYAAYSVTEQTDSLTGIMMELLGSEKCATARSYISGLKSDKAQKPENGWKETIRKELKKQGLSQSEIAIVLYASGYRGEEETEALIKALNAKKYSAEKLQMIAKILNLTVKNGKLVN